MWIFSVPLLRTGIHGWLKPPSKASECDIERPWSHCATAPPYHPKTCLLPLPCRQHLVSRLSPGKILRPLWQSLRGLSSPSSSSVTCAMWLCWHRTAYLHVFITAESSKTCICMNGLVCTWYVELFMYKVCTKYIRTMYNELVCTQYVQSIYNVYTYVVQCIRLYRSSI